MTAPALVYAEWAKGKYDSYFLDSIGFYGYMHPRGCVFKYLMNTREIDPSITFLTSTNQNTSGRYFICAMNKEPFSMIKPRSEIDCELVLLVGVTIVLKEN